ncbi:MAG: exodeoxyribonuclease VII small subunit [Bacteroidales bacterium]|nr:exodeoxyribonuclease VII small subunit [Bacteroidales bacterium]
MTKKEITFSEAMKEVGQILGKMERGEMDIDELSSGVRRASELIKICQKKLKATEEEIESIFSED